MSDRTFDVRTIERNIKHGFLSRDEVTTHLAGLPDVADKATHMPPLDLSKPTDMDSVGRYAPERTTQVDTPLSPDDY
ncbi:MAG TPA: hypothetical protein VFG83_04885 [Kofleriaceae bacterium]|nr:hypothetical protein [Kofleriaceae bacterium]